MRARAILLDVGEVKESIQLESKVTIEINGVKKPDCVAEMITRNNFKNNDPHLEEVWSCSHVRKARRRDPVLFAASFN